MRSTRIMLAALLLVGATSPLGAANREHEQLMADIRMLQEQNQRLQQALVSLADTLKTVTARLDEQGAATRKGFADQKLVVDSVAGDLRVLREKLDETNVRLTSLSQDVDGVRDMIPKLAAQPAPLTSADPSAVPAQPPSPGTAPAPAGATPLGAGAERGECDGHNPAAAVRNGLRRLHGRPVVPGRPGIRDVPEDVSEVRSCRRRAVLHRRVVQRRQPVPRGGGRLRTGDLGLPAKRYPSRGVLQGRDHVRAARTAGSRPHRVPSTP